MTKTQNTDGFSTDWLGWEGEKNYIYRLFQIIID